MDWKNWPYWKKGLAVSVVILLFLQLIGFILFIIGENTVEKNFASAIINLSFLVLPGTLILVLLNPILNLDLGSSFTKFIITMIIAYLLYPIGGIIIGLLISKIKKNKNLEKRV